MGWQLVLAFASFLFLAVLFALRAMGGGDVKLLTALALWIPPVPYMHLLTVMAVAGGLLTIVFGAWHITRKRKERVAIPYGVAIAIGGLWVMGFEYLPLIRAGSPVG